MLPQAYFAQGGVYGPGMEPSTLVSKLFQAAIEGETIRTHQYENGCPSFDLIYVDDFVSAIELAMKRWPRQVTHVGSGVSTSTYDLAQKVVETLHSKSSVKLHNIDDTTCNVAVDPKESLVKLGWEATTSPELGLEMTANSFGQPS